MLQQRTRNRQTLAIQPTQSVAAAVDADKRPQVALIKARHHPAWLEELLKIVKGDLTAGVRIEWVTSANGLGVEAMHLALITLVDVHIGLLQQMPPTVIGHTFEPAGNGQRQARGGVTQIAQCILLALHALPGTQESRLLGCAVTVQCRQLQVYFIQQAQRLSQLYAGVVLLIQQLMQRLKAALQGAPRRLDNSRLPCRQPRLGHLAQVCRLLGHFVQQSMAWQQTRIFTHLLQETNQRRLRRRQVHQLLGILAQVVSLLQPDSAKRIAPGIGILAEIALLQFSHQAPQVLRPQVGALPEHPVVLGDGVYQARALRIEVLHIAFGIEPRHRRVDSGEHLTLGQPQRLQAARLFAQYPIDPIGQRFAPQRFTGLRHPLFVERHHKRLLQQPRQVRIKALLCRHIPGKAYRPKACDMFCQPGRVTALAQIEHQVGTQVVEQPLPVPEAGNYLFFQLGGCPGQKWLLQRVIIGLIDAGTAQFALIQPGALHQAYICRPWKNLGRRQSRVQQRQQRRAFIVGRKGERRV